MADREVDVRLVDSHALVTKGDVGFPVHVRLGFVPGVDAAGDRFEALIISPDRPSLDNYKITFTRLSLWQAMNSPTSIERRTIPL